MRVIGISLNNKRDVLVGTFVLAERDVKWRFRIKKKIQIKNRTRSDRNDHE